MIEKKPCIVLFGLAGSGKGTQGDVLSNKHSFIRIAPGDILRSKIEEGTLPLNVSESIKAGNLVDPMDVTKIVMNYIRESSKKDEIKGYVLDGFPRNMEQDNLFKGLLKEDEGVDAVLFFDIKKEILLDRLKNRFYCKSCNAVYNKVTKPTKIEGICDVCGSDQLMFRNDDADITSINKRFEIFTRETVSVIEGYKLNNFVWTIDASLSPEEIASQIDKWIVEKIKVWKNI